MVRQLVGFVVFVWSVSAFAEPKDLRGPDPEVGRQTQIDLPALPSFEMPPSEPGYVGVHELRVAGRKHFDTEVKVKGYIIWIYNCVSAEAKPGESRAKTQRRIDDDPTRCERMKFYLGQTPKDAPETGLWVVDVPRPPNKLERERLPKEELRNWPKVPKLKVGAFVVVTGKLAVSSPHSERNSDGLVVFQAIAPATKSPAAKPRPAATPPARPAVPPPAIKKATIAPKDAASRERSNRLKNEGTLAYGQRKYAEAIAAYTKSIAEWPGNHIAYYGLAGARIGMRDWAAARDAMRRAVALVPDEAMYRMVYGYTLYESAIAHAKEAEAKKQNRTPEEVFVDVSAIDFAEALSSLTQAIKLNRQLWRAHYYIGRIHRDGGNARWAAESFDEALRSAPSDPGPWVALGELYRRWSYTDQAIAVAKAGTAVVADSTDVWYVLGMAYDDKRRYDEAIDAFTRALDARPDNAKALFQRGQAYFHKRDYKRARSDLEAFRKTAGGSLDFASQQAARMLMDIAANKK